MKGVVFTELFEMVGGLFRADMSENQNTGNECSRIFTLTEH
ncbi:MAG: hypothetical protein ACRBCK_06420 [Alphaproteobacteria bacterium]